MLNLKTNKNMKGRRLLIIGLMGLLVSCSNTPQSAKLCTVDVEGAMENSGELKLSELASDVRYVPLETTDSCLIGANPNILLLDKQIVVYSNKECLLFNKADGKFLCRLGHGGDDPEAYSYPVPFYNEHNEMFYFKREPEWLQKYDASGRYQGKLKIPTPPAMPSEFGFMDSLVIGHYNNIAMGYAPRALLLFNEKGEEVDTVPSLLPVLSKKEVSDIDNINVKRLGDMMIVLTRFKDGGYMAGIGGRTFLWNSKGETRFKESFNDTAFTVRRSELAPYIVFKTGKWHWGAEARTDSKDNEKRLLIGEVFESSQAIFFQCICGLYTNEPEMLNGIYNRKSGMTYMSPEKNGIIDNINGFMPFHPKACSPQGEYAGLVEAGEAMDWLKEHSELARNSKFSVLKGLTEDDNPVVVIAKP
jgi:hypothetical protein